MWRKTTPRFVPTSTSYVSTYRGTKSVHRPSCCGKNLPMLRPIAMANPCAQSLRVSYVQATPRRGYTRETFRGPSDHYKQSYGTHAYVPQFSHPLAETHQAVTRRDWTFCPFAENEETQSWLHTAGYGRSSRGLCATSAANNDWSRRTFVFIRRVGKLN